MMGSRSGGGYSTRSSSGGSEAGESAASCHVLSAHQNSGLCKAVHEILLFASGTVRLAFHGATETL